jgi:rare lipoprotein A
MRIALARARAVGLVLLPALMLSACAARSTPPSTPSAPAASRAILEVRQGLASYYGPGFEGKRTASGILFDKTAMVAAHPTYPFGTVVRVTNLANNRRVELRVVDRGPAKGPRAQGVLIDVSSGAAENLGFIRQGRTKVRLEVLRWGS